VPPPSMFEPPPLTKPWDRIDRAQRFLLKVAQGSLPPDVLRERDDDALQRLSLNLAHVLRLLHDDFKATSAIRRAFADEHRTGAPLENYLTRLADTLVDLPEEPAE
jgi:hypothetical protein